MTSNLHDRCAWSYLPRELLACVLENLLHMSDFVAFSAVCKPWCSSVVDNFNRNPWRWIEHDNFNHNSGKEFPLLLVPDGEGKRRLIRVNDQKEYGYRLSIPYNRRLCGSSHGWLFTIDKSRVISLLNPLSGKIIRLPPIIAYIQKPRVFQGEEGIAASYFQLGDFMGLDDNMEITDEKVCVNNVEHLPVDEEDDDVDDEYIDNDGNYYEFVRKSPFNYEYSIQKGILSKDPELYPDDYVVMVIYGSMSRLAFIKSGDKDWTYLHPALLNIEDVIHYQGKFLAMRYFGDVWSCDVNCFPPKVTRIAPNLGRTDGCFTKRYLVESPSGEVVMIIRRFSNGSGMTMDCGVFKLKNSKWIRTTNLDGAALFLGDNHSISVLVSDFPRCCGNCVYFTDDYYHIYAYTTPYREHGSIPCDNCVYNLNDGNLSRYHEFDNSHGQIVPLIWMLPKI